MDEVKELEEGRVPFSGNYDEDNIFIDGEPELNFEDVENEYQDLMSPSIDKSLIQHDVKTVYLEEQKEVDEKACIIDIDGYEGIIEASFMSIKNMLEDDGEYCVYIKNGENMQNVGKTSERKALRLMPEMIDSLYGGNVKYLILRDGKIKKYNRDDVSVIRIRLR